jgi:hypothetical protein
MGSMMMGIVTSSEDFGGMTEVGNAMFDQLQRLEFM